MIVEEGGEWVFEIPTHKVVPVPPPRPRLVVEEELPEAVELPEPNGDLVTLPTGATVRIPRY